MTQDPEIPGQLALFAPDYPESHGTHGPHVPSLEELKARWKQNREDDLAAAEDATWD